MSSTTTLESTATTIDIASDEIVFPPIDIYSNEPPLESELHLDQIVLLLSCLKWLWKDRTDFYAAGNLTIYYSPEYQKSRDFRGPDFFVVLDTERKTRKSWVVWAEDGKYPNLIVEILSKSTAKIDRELKKQLYQDTFRTPDYFWFDPETQELAGFHLVDGKYQPLNPNPQGHLWSEQLQLNVGIHNGFLRFFTPSGELIPVPIEIVEQESHRAEQESQRAEQESLRAKLAEEKAERLAAKLKEFNIDPD
jgi:Uma2 family endonuclease